MMANQNPSESAFLSVLEQLRSSRTLHFKPIPPLRVAVLALDRYLAGACASDSGESCDYDYDVTLTDGRWRVKCALARRLTRAAQVNTLRCGSAALLEHLSLVYDETRLGRSCVRVEQARFDPSSAYDILGAIKDPDAIRWWTHEAVGSSALADADVPLRHNRRHYLSLWNTEDPHGTVWLPYTPPADVPIDVSKIAFLGDLEAILAMSRRPYPLLVRVLHRSRLRFYGKPGQKITFPFQAYLEVADQTGIMSLVLWNELCPEWYQRLLVGSVLYLQDYKLKRSYQNRSRPQLSTLPLTFYRSTEICLNPRSPSAIITVIPPKSVQPQWNLPEVTYNFSTRCEVESLASNQACDIVGLVTYVSRVERIRNRGNTVPEKFWMYRWVHVVDGTSDAPFILEIFASSQPEIFNRIFPMAYLVCTHMRVCRETGSGSAFYLTSSTETQLFSTGCHKKQPYLSDPKVKAFIQWTKTQKDRVVMRKTAVGGRYCYPPPPPVFTPNTSGARDLQKELESLQYREHRRVAVQGHITAVQYHRWPPGAPHTTSLNEQQVEHDSGGVARGSTSSLRTRVQQPSETSSTSSQSDDKNPPKRRRVVHATQKQYWTRAKQQLERLLNPVDLTEDEEESRRRPDEEGSEALSGPSPRPTDITETPRSTPDTSSARPIASWESSMWAILKQSVKDHVRCASLDRESVPEKFRFDDRDVVLHRLNLSPAKWSPDHPSEATSDIHTPVNFTGYLTLTILGLNQEAAVDSLFLPVYCPEDPRAVGTSYSLHDDTLTSCLSTGHIFSQVNFSPETFLSSASALEDERVVCLLDVCLLAENRVEIVCTKVYRTAEIIAPV
ncbi:RPA-related protein RADX isoform X2 [Silurus meridionalis]|uniref:RPA-related protein RADX isoform X2 n=1 Tax=Silurus meridionalis TaxID=175797 RepID=UPI001EEA5392|nr:RPA-related protein RADX isoform X2 [Silurus meridionalis]